MFAGMSIARDNTPRGTAQRRIAAIDRAIARLRVLQELAQTVEGNHQRRSDRGWMVSMLTLEVGTLMAVLSGARARGWGGLVRTLELEILRLRIDRMQAEREAQTRSDDL
jgi:hypothetical protein